ncbi:MAG: hypothetical protein ACI90A_001174, partial [Shewanella sp.]
MKDDLQRSHPIPILPKAKSENVFSLHSKVSYLCPQGATGNATGLVRSK